MTHAHEDRELLFGLLALQNAFIDTTTLVTALHARGRPVGEVLVEAGALAEPQRELLEALTAEHVGRRGGDVEKSLAALPIGASTRERLARLADADRPLCHRR